MNLGALKALTVDRKRMFRAAGGALMVVDVSEFLVEWPEGDPDGARKAAGYWRDIAARVNESLTTTSHAAGALGKQNKGKGVAAFETFFVGEMTPFPLDVSSYATNIAKACDDYADLLERVQHALIVMKLIQLTEDVIFCLWPEISAEAYFFNKELRRKQAGFLLRLLKSFIESSWFVVLDQVVKAGWHGAFGDGIAWSKMPMDALKTLIGAMVFYQIDGRNFGLGTRGADAIWKRVTAYWVGSNLFTDTVVAEQDPGKIKDDPLSFFDPSLDVFTQLRKLILPFAQEPAAGGGANPRFWRTPDQRAATP